ncbi:ABC transporter ATP-binding protein [Halobacteriales archaeon SW_5_70_135]|nr:MAG: ABC transporter ATP-binding protein [Halobacteriales archaeon SW_5_70_135]
MTDPLLQLTDVYSGYGDAEVLHGVDLRVDSSETVAVVGPNGAGKSTVFRTIFGLLTPTAGTVEYDGEVISGLSPPEVLRRGLAYVPQQRSTFPEMTVEENLEMSGYLKDDVDERIERVFERFPVLREKRHDRAETLSGGQQQMMEMAGGLIMEADLLLLDEPSAGLAPTIVDDVFERVRDLNDDGTTFLVIEQNAHRALRVADRGYVVERGTVAIEGEADELLADEEVQRLYLGGRGAEET